MNPWARALRWTRHASVSTLLSRLPRHRLILLFTFLADFDLCSRWMELSAFFPFYRNHNVKATIGQEAFRWSSVAEASRRAMSVRYSLLNYMYTLFHYAHMKGDTVMRALAWE